MRVTGLQELAAFFGVSDVSIQNWLTEGLPVATRGAPGLPHIFESVDCIKWYASREVNRAGVEGVRDRLFRLQAESLEMDLATKRGKLIPADQLEPRFKSVAVAARESLRNESVRLASLMEGSDRRAREDLLRDAFDAFLRKLSRWDTATNSDPVDDDDDDDAHANAGAGAEHE